MSDRPIDTNLTEKSDAELVSELKARQERRADLKAKAVRVLDRGVTGDRQQVELPDDKYGEWVPDDKMEIFRMEALGFHVDKEYASKRALHDAGGDGTSKIADTIFMVCDREMKEVIDEIERERYEAANSPRGGKQKEERDFASEAKQVGLPDATKSRVDSTTLSGIKAALDSGRNEKS
jgi:hypothetical protein